MAVRTQIFTCKSNMNCGNLWTGLTMSPNKESRSFEAVILCCNSRDSSLKNVRQLYQSDNKEMHTTTWTSIQLVSIPLGSRQILVFVWPTF